MSTRPSTAPTYRELSAEILLRPLMTIILSEIDDKTFFISVILSMRHARLVVFLGAFNHFLRAREHALSVIGSYTTYALDQEMVMAGVLSLVFGSKMVMEGKEIEEGKVEEDM